MNIIFGHKADELDDYNHSNTIVHRGDGFVVYETDGYYEISFFKKLEELWTQSMLSHY